MMVSSLKEDLRRPENFLGIEDDIAPASSDQNKTQSSLGIIREKRPARNLPRGGVHRSASDTKRLRSRNLRESCAFHKLFFEDYPLLLHPCTLCVRLIGCFWKTKRGISKGRGEELLKFSSAVCSGVTVIDQ
jgi:hypothetical protein